MQADEQPVQASASSTPEPTPALINAPPTLTVNQPLLSPPPQKPHRRRWFLGLTLLILLVAGSFWLLGKHSASPKAVVVVTKQATSSANKTSTSATTTQGLQLDPNKDYGNKYANGIVPVGDGKYVTSAPKQGYIYACSMYAQNLTSSQGGAGTRGPWFEDNNTEYDINKKLHVQGSVMWQASFTINEVNGVRTIVTNDLPNHPTGIFPISSTDPAYAYDHNPNSIKGQTLTYALDANPVYGSPSCMGGESGIMLTGVALFNGFDAGGRDAGAWEVQDACDGHPQMDGEYHYHTLSTCIKDASVHTVIGYALDGFPITGPDVGPNNILTTADLDECHGITSEINLDGKQVTMYHYVMTQDFPYSVSCFRGTAIQPPGLH